MVPPAPRAMGPVGGTGGTRVWGVWVPGRPALVAGLGRAPVVQRRVRKTNASAGRAFLPGRKAIPLKTSVSLCRHVGEPRFPELVTAQAANAQAEEPIAAGTTTPPGGTSSSQAFSAAFTDPEAHVNGTIAQELRDRDLLGAERCALAAVWPRRSSRDVVCYRAGRRCRFFVGRR